VNEFGSENAPVDIYIHMKARCTRSPSKNYSQALYMIYIMLQAVILGSLPFSEMKLS